MGKAAGWWSSNRTVIGAVMATVLLGVLVHRHALQSSRAILPLVFAWMLALHASDYRAAAEEHARRVRFNESRVDPSDLRDALRQATLETRGQGIAED